VADAARPSRAAQGALGQPVLAGRGLHRLRRAEAVASRLLYCPQHGEARMVASKQAAYAERIIQDPAILVGKPVVKGTRIPVELVLAKLAYNPDLTELFADYPRLTVDDVKACLEYAAALVRRQRKARPAAVPTARRVSA
jgi:uncharacterized protein (DUF433 family)